MRLPRVGEAPPPVLWLILVCSLGRGDATPTDAQPMLAAELRSNAHFTYLGRLNSRVEAREGVCSILVALGSGALEPVSGFAEVDFRAFSIPVTAAKVALRIGIALIRRERVVPERFFLRIK